MLLRVWIVLALLTLTACGGGGGGGGGGSPVPAPLPSRPPEPNGFVDVTAASNISYVVAITRAYDGSGTALQIEDVTFGGAAAGDCDSDGDVDLFITYGDGGPNRLYINQLNNGSGTPLQFVDRANTAGVANSRSDGAGNDRHSGPTFADIDGDGDLDLFLGGLFSDPNKLYENRGDCTFDDVTAGSGIDALSAEQTISAAFGDYDLDGDLDLFLTHWGSVYASSTGEHSEHLFRNVSDANGIRFEDVSAATGVAALLIAHRDYSTEDNVTDYTFTPTFARINDDLWPDLAIAADFGTAQLLLNNGSVAVGFRDASNAAVHSVEYGMGSALGDYDFDGDLDWFVTSIFSDDYEYAVLDDPTGNRLFRNPGGDFSLEQFENVTEQAGIAVGGWGWAACFVDIDNDTDLDIYHANGWGGVRERSRVFVSDGNGGFLDEAADLDLDLFADSRGVVCADFDNDGDVDILELTKDDQNSAAFWMNDTVAAGRNYLRVRLVGLPPNTEAAGARIFARIGGQTQMREIMIGSNYTSQNPAVQIFGLGNATAVDELRIEWPPLLPGPGQPAEWVSRDVAASAPGTTLVICHPQLLPAPAECYTP